MTTPSSSANATYPIAKSVSLSNNQSERPPQELSNILMESVSAFLPLDGNLSSGGCGGQVVAPPLTTTSTIGMPTSMAGYQSQSPLGQAAPPSMNPQQQPQQQQQQNKQHMMPRPIRSSVPVHPGKNKN